MAARQPGASLQANGQLQKKVEEVLTSHPRTEGYKPSLPSQMWSGLGPNFYLQILFDVERMIPHPHVAMPLSYFKSGIDNAEFEVVDASSAAVGDFALKEIESFWERGLEELKVAYEYGWGGFELGYQYDDADLLRWNWILGFAPMDVRVLTDNDRYLGVRVKNVGENGVDLWRARPHIPAKGFWYVHNRRFHRWYGRSQLIGAWRPWRKLAGTDGAEDIVHGGFYRFAYRGPVGYYPQGTTNVPGRGMVHNGELMREMAEGAKAGLNVLFPSDLLPDGKTPAWRFDWPEYTLDVEGLLHYPHDLKDEIAYGIGVPPELIREPEGGTIGGVGGRGIPKESFLLTQQRIARNIVRAWAGQVIKPCAVWNFGPSAHFEIKVKSLVKTQAQDAAGAPGGTQPPQFAQANAAKSQAAQSKPFQLSIEDPAALAAATAELLNAREARNEPVHAAELSLLSAQLDSKGYVVFWSPYSRRWESKATAQFIAEAYDAHAPTPELPVECALDGIELAAPTDPQIADAIAAMKDTVNQMAHQKQPEVHVHIPEIKIPPVTFEVKPEIKVEIPATVVNVAAAPAPTVTVNVPEQPAPNVTVNVPQPADVAPVVNVAPARVTVEQPPRKKKIAFEYDRQGNMKSAEATEE